MESWGRYIRSGPQASGAQPFVLGNSLKLRAFISHVLLGFAVFAAQFARADCECPPESVERAILKADRIFRGEVVSASISGDDSQTIEFVVKVDKAIRGNQEKEYRLTTRLPDSCGVSARLGFHDMYVLGPNETSVSNCTGSGRATYKTYPLLAVAIALVDLPLSDTSGAQRLLSKQFYSSYDRATVDQFFELVEKIDPIGNRSTAMSDRIEYRGIVVYFTGGKYEKVGVL